MTFEKLFPCEVCTVQGKPFLFTNLRVDRNTVPDDMFAYDVRDDCDGEFWEIQKYVMVNHWGTIVGFSEVDLDENGQYFCPPEETNEDVSSEGASIDTVKSLFEYEKKYN